MDMFHEHNCHLSVPQLNTHLKQIAGGAWTFSLCDVQVELLESNTKSNYYIYNNVWLAYAV